MTRIIACYIKEIEREILKSHQKPMIYGIGVDLVKIPRIQAALENWGERFHRKIYTEAEQSYCLSKTRQARYWAMRFAAKEAFSKAIGLGMRGGIRWRDIEVTSNVFGKPELVLHGRARELCQQAGIKSSFLTLSDEAEIAVAVVILET
ncbi:MAG TPA: holo-ACP synthase [Thermodesulfobacteriota bacterium]|nr:holo-ACP synthase [Thermodesulfobacteriota bacterium]